MRRSEKIKRDRRRREQFNVAQFAAMEKARLVRLHERQKSFGGAEWRAESCACDRCRVVLAAKRRGK